MLCTYNHNLKKESNSQITTNMGFWGFGVLGFWGFFGAWMTFKKAEMAKTLRNG